MKKSTKTPQNSFEIGNLGDLSQAKKSAGDTLSSVSYPLTPVTKANSATQPTHIPQAQRFTKFNKKHGIDDDASEAHLDAEPSALASTAPTQTEPQWQRSDDVVASTQAESLENVTAPTNQDAPTTSNIQPLPGEVPLNSPSVPLTSPSPIPPIQTAAQATVNAPAIGTSSITGLAGGLGLVAMLAAAGGSNKSGAAANNTQTDEGQPTGAVYVVNLALGPINDSGAGTEVKFYKADGTEIAGTGSFSGNGTYTFKPSTPYGGKVFVRIKDGDDAADYVDEKTGTAKSIGGEMWAATEVASSSTSLVVTVTPLTTIAFKKALQVDNVAQVVEKVQAKEAATVDVLAANKAIAKLFGVGDVDLAQQKVDFAVDLDGKATHTANAYGKALAVVSNYDIDQSKAIAEIAAAIKIDKGTASLVESTITTKLVAAATTPQVANQAASNVAVATIQEVVQVQDTTAPVFSAGATRSLNLAENTKLVTGSAASASDNTAVASYSLVGGADQGLFNIDALTGTLSFKTQPDYETPSSAANSNVYTVQIKAQDAAGNSALQTVTVSVTDVDEVPPSFTEGDNKTLSLPENSSLSFYTESATDNVGVTAYEWAGGADDGKFNLNTYTGAISFKQAPNFETPASAAGSNTYALKIRAKDAAGNSALQTVTVNVTDIDEVAPQIAANALSLKTTNSAGVTKTTTLVAGDKIVLSVNLGEAASGLLNLPTGNNTALIKLGSTSKTASWSTDGNNLLLTYTVAPGDSGSIRHDPTSLLSLLKGASIKDLAGNAAKWPTSFTQVATLSYGVDTAAPTFTAGASISVNFAENGTGTVYTPSASDNSAIAGYEFAGGDDDDKFTIDTHTGAISFKQTPDFETPASAAGSNAYTVKLRVKDPAGNSAVQTVTVNVSDVDDTAPVIAANALSVSTTDASGASKTSTLVANDKVLVALALDEAASGLSGLPTGSVNNVLAIGGVSKTATWSASGNSLLLSYTVAAGDAGAISLDKTALLSALGSSIKDLAGNAATLPASFSAPSMPSNAVDAAAPVFVAGASTSVSFAENGTGTVYTPSASDDSAIASYELAGGDDDGKFTINTHTGAISFKQAPDFETPASAAGSNTYTVKIRATDAAGNAAIQTIAVNVGEVNETAPVFSSNNSGVVLENANIDTVVYTAVATDADGSNHTVTYSLKDGGDKDLLHIDSATGVVTLKTSANFEAKASYQFTVVATDSGSPAFSTEQSVTVKVTDVSYTADQVFTLWQAAATDSSALQSISQELAEQQDIVTRDGSGNQASELLRLDEWVDGVTGTDIVSPQEYAQGLVITGRASPGETGIRWRLDNDRTDGIEGQAALPLQIGDNDVDGDGVNDVHIAYDSDSGEWRMTFAANSPALKQGEWGKAGSGVHQLVVDTNGDGLQNNGEASRLFLLASGTAAADDDGSAVRNYSVQDAISGNVFVYYYGDPDGTGTSLWTALDENDTRDDPTNVWNDQDGNLLDEDFYASTDSSLTPSNLAARMHTQLSARVWEFHAATLQREVTGWAAANALAQNHQVTGSNTGRLASLQEFMALFAANFGADSAGSVSTNTALTPGAMQAMNATLSQAGYSDTANDNTPAHWLSRYPDSDAVYWTAAPSPLGNASVSLTSGQIVDSHLQASRQVMVVLAGGHTQAVPASASVPIDPSDTTPPTTLSLTAPAVDNFSPVENWALTRKFSIGGLEAGATWYYQVGQTGWKQGQGQSFSVPDGQYGSNQTVQVRQKDASGNFSAVTTFSGNLTVASSKLDILATWFNKVQGLASGGREEFVLVDGEVKVLHKFLALGNAIGSYAFSTTENMVVDYFVLGGGGGGGSGFLNSTVTGGGGSSGQLITQTDKAISSGSYSVVVGKGGYGGYNPTYSNKMGENGGVSSIFQTEAKNGIGGGTGDKAVTPPVQSVYNGSGDAGYRSDTKAPTLGATPTVIITDAKGLVKTGNANVGDQITIVIDLGEAISELAGFPVNAVSNVFMLNNIGLSASWSQSGTNLLLTHTVGTKDNNGNLYTGNITINLQNLSNAIATSIRDTDGNNYIAKPIFNSISLPTNAIISSVINSTSNQNPHFIDGVKKTVSIIENLMPTVYQPSVRDRIGITGYTLSGDDADKFNINATTGVITLKNPLDYENPTSLTGGNIYKLKITATTQRAATVSQDIDVMVVNYDELNTAGSSGHNGSVNSGGMGGGGAGEGGSAAGMNPGAYVLNNFTGTNLPYAEGGPGGMGSWGVSDYGRRNVSTVGGDSSGYDATREYNLWSNNGPSIGTASAVGATGSGGAGASVQGGSDGGAGLVMVRYDAKVEESHLLALLQDIYLGPVSNITLSKLSAYLNAIATIDQPLTAQNITAAIDSLALDNIAPITNLVPGFTTSSSGSVTVRSSETGKGYLVKTLGYFDRLASYGSVKVTDEESILSATQSKWKAVDVLANINTTVSLAGLEQGTYAFYAVDEAGNLSTASNQVFTIDTEKPSVRFNYDSAITVLNNTYDAANIEVNESSMVYIVNTKVTVTDLASIQAASDNLWNVSSDLIKGAYNVGPGRVSLAGLLDGTYCLYNVDMAGNLSLASARSMVIDRTGPTSATLEQGFRQSVGSVAVQSSEIGMAYLVKTGGANAITVSNLVSITSAVDSKFNAVSVSVANADMQLPLTGLEDGTYQLYTADAVGNLSAASNNVLTIDNLAPTVTLPTGEGYRSNSILVSSTEVGTAYLVKTSGDGAVTVSNLASITSAGAGKYTSISINAASTNTSLSLAGLENGSYTLYAVDRAGNFSTGSSTNYTIVTAPGTLDPLVLTMPTDDGLSNTDGATRNNTATVSGVVNGATWEYKIGDGAWTAGSGTTFTLPMGLYNASNVVQVRQSKDGQSSDIISFVGNNLRIVDSAGESALWLSAIEALTVGGTERFVMGTGNQLMRLHQFTDTAAGQSLRNKSTGDITLEYLVVGGGAAGGSSKWGNAGGGGGGEVNAGQMSVASGQSLSVTVGAGSNGAYAANPNDNLSPNGGNSVLATVTSLGGGAGGIANNNNGAMGKPGANNAGTGGGAGSQGSWPANDVNAPAHSLTWISGGNSTVGEGAGGMAGLNSGGGGGGGNAVSGTLNNPSSDSTAPLLMRGEVSNNGLTITLAYNEALNGSNLPAPSTFKARTWVLDTNGTTKIWGGYVQPTNVVVADNLMVLTFANALDKTKKLELTYTDPTTGNDVNALQDMAGNDTLSFTTNMVNLATGTADTVMPHLLGSRVSGTDAYLYFSEAMQATGLPATTAFTATVKGESRTVTAVSVSGSAVKLTLSGASIATGDAVVIGYKDPSSGNDTTGVLQDVAGNDWAGFGTGGSASLTSGGKGGDGVASDITGSLMYYGGGGGGNYYQAGATGVGAGGLGGGGAGASKARIAFFYREGASDTLAPGIVGRDTSTDGTQILLHFSEALGNLGTLPTTAFPVTVAGTARAVSSLSVVNGNTVALTLESAVTAGQAVTVAYNDPSANNDSDAIQDQQGNDAVTSAATTVTNRAGTYTDTTAPAIQSFFVDNSGANSKVVMVYSELLDPNVTPQLASLSVHVQNDARTVSAAQVQGATVILTLEGAKISNGQQVVVGYNDKTTANDTAGVIQDLKGNDAPSFSAAAGLIASYGAHVGAANTFGVNGTGGGGGGYGGTNESNFGSSGGSGAVIARFDLGVDETALFEAVKAIYTGDNSQLQIGRLANYLNALEPIFDSGSWNSQILNAAITAVL